jgi:hypothetical protein
MSEPSEPAGGIWLSQGRLHFTCASYEQWLAPCIAVALFARDADWLLLPLLAGAGGLQVKMRNARGDRVIETQEFFRGHGMEDSPEIQLVCLHTDAVTGGWRMQLV